LEVALQRLSEEEQASQAPGLCVRRVGGRGRVERCQINQCHSRSVLGADRLHYLAHGLRGIEIDDQAVGIRWLLTTDEARLEQPDGTLVSTAQELRQPDARSGLVVN